MAKKSKSVEDDVVETGGDKREEERIDKLEVLTSTKKLDKKYGKVAQIDLKQRDPYLPRSLENQLRKDILKMKAITANELASKYDVRVSSMKKFLLDLESEGKLSRSSSSSRLKVFNPV